MFLVLFEFLQSYDASGLHVVSLGRGKTLAAIKFVVAVLSALGQLPHPKPGVKRMKGPPEQTRVSGGVDR